jgi:hypothetical protein
VTAGGELLRPGVRFPDVVAEGRVRGILFDSGGVLVRPVGGRWNPRFDFEEILLAHHPSVQVDLFPAAFAAGDRFVGAGTGPSSRSPRRVPSSTSCAPTAC